MKVFFVLFVSTMLCSISMYGQVSESMVNEVLQKMVSQGELKKEDMAYRMTDHYMSQKGKIDHMYFCQMMNGIDIYGAMGSIHVLPNNTIVSKDVQFVNGIADKMEPLKSAAMSAEQAVLSAAKHKSLTLNGLAVIGGKGGASKHTLFNTGGISMEDIPASLIYYHDGDQIKLSWKVSISAFGGNHYWEMFIDANDGSLLHENDLVIECFNADLSSLRPASSSKTAFQYPLTIAENQKRMDEQVQRSLMLSPDSYRVWAFPLESPNFGPSSLVVNPADGTASPFGWHDTNGVAGAEFTITRGNNVYAYTDTDFNNLPDAASSPSGGPGLDFDFAADVNMAPSAYTEAAVTNLFYVCNMVHDITYQYGFDEAAGNFQVNNYGKGGVGGDHVNAEARDGGGNCNANFNTNVDGVPGRMQMFLCDLASPLRDGSLDNGVIAHEYGHGISTRLVGGPSSLCLGNAEQMGEGWSDFFALIFQMKAGDAGPDPKGMGTWLLGQGPNGAGVRATPNLFGVAGSPYSTDMMVNNETYDSIKNDVRFPGVHGVGYVWAVMLWDMTWNLVDHYGFDPDIYNGVGGNNIALQLVIEGLKLTPCSPGFIDGRNAILAADQAL